MNCNLVYIKFLVIILYILYIYISIRNKKLSFLRIWDQMHRYLIELFGTLCYLGTYGMLESLSV